MSWQDDPIVTPAPTANSGGGWQNDPIVKPAPSSTSSSSVVFGSNRGVAPVSEENRPSTQAAINATATGVTALPAAVLNAGKTIGQLETGQPDQDGLDKAVTSMNQTREGWMQGNPAAKGMDIAGQMAMPMAGGEAAVGKVMSYAPEALQAGAKGLAARGAVRAGIGASQGAEVEAMNPHDNETRSQIASKEGSAATTGAVINTGLGIGGKINDWWQSAKNYIGKKGIEQSTGETLEPLIGGQKGVDQLEQHVVNNPQAKDMTTAQVLQNRDLASAEKDVLKGTAKNEVQARTQVTNEQLANQVKANAPEITAPTQTEVQEKTGGVARDISNVERQGIKDAYKAVAPDDTIKAPLAALQDRLDEIRKDNKQLIHGTTEEEEPSEAVKNLRSSILGAPAPEAAAKEGKEVAPDRILSEIDNRYAEGESGSVQQMVQDKNNLGTYINGQYKSLKNGTLDSDQQYFINKKIDVAQQMRDALKEHLSGLDNVPSAVGGKSVSEAFEEAEGKYKEYANKYLENPEQFKLNDEGKQYNFSESDFGANDAAIQKGTAPSLAEAGRNVLSIENPDKLGAQLKNWRNAPDADNLVKENLLAAVKEKGYDKAFTPEIEAQLNKNGFGGVASEVKTTGILHDIGKSVSTTPNKLGEGSTTTVDYDKYYEGFNKNREYLQKNLPKDQFDALDTLSKELAQNTFVARTNANIGNEIGESNKTNEKVAEIALKSTLSKIAGIPIGGAASIANLFKGIRTAKIEEVVQDALTNPLRALSLIKAAQAEKEAPGALQTFFNGVINKLPAAAADVPAHSDQTLIKEQKAASKSVGPQSQNEAPNEKTFLSQFNPISDANASEPTVGTSKKNNEFQIADASKQTGMPKEYFDALEKAETGSIKNPNKARNPNSTAYGLSQFTEKTWNGLSEEYDLPPVTNENRYTKDDPRSNPKYSRLAAGYYGSDNADNLRPWIKSKFNRDATIGDVYGAHLMGLSGVKQFLAADPESIAADIVPAAAKNNKSLFYADKGKGKALSVRQVYRNIEDRLMPESKDITNEPDF